MILEGGFRQLQKSTNDIMDKKIYEIQKVAKRYVGRIRVLGLRLKKIDGGITMVE